MSIDPPVDAHCLNTMRTLLDGDYGEVLAGFLRDAERYIGEIGMHINENNPQAAAAVAHKLKSSSGQFGFRRLQQVATQLEHPGDNPQTLLASYHHDLEEAYHQTKEFLSRYALNP